MLLRGNSDTIFHPAFVKHDLLFRMKVSASLDRQAFLG
jgi:hypothetical protein